jgi:RNA polymerase sigma factor (sigma-70 family)
MSWGDADDATLVRDAQAGDASSLGALLERHRALLLAAAVGRLGHGPQAEDAVQDTFLIALRRIGQLRNPAAARGWLLAILVNVCRMQVRRTPVEPVMDLGEGWAAEPGSVEEVIDRLALRDWVWAALERLSEPLRLAVMLRYFTAAASYEAIADLCAIPVGTVRSRLHAGRARLADELLAIASAPHPDAARWRQQAGGWDARWRRSSGAATTGCSARSSPPTSGSRWPIAWSAEASTDSPPASPRISKTASPPAQSASSPAPSSRWLSSGSTAHPTSPSIALPP